MCKHLDTKGQNQVKSVQVHFDSLVAAFKKYRKNEAKVDEENKEEETDEGKLARRVNMFSVAHTASSQPTPSSKEKVVNAQQTKNICITFIQC